MEASHGNKSDAARRLGINRRLLYEKLAQFCNALGSRCPFNLVLCRRDLLTVIQLPAIASSRQKSGLPETGNFTRPIASWKT